MPVDHKAEAQKIIDSGDSIEFLVKTFLSLYVGNKETGQILLAAIGCQAILNSDGIHPRFSGGSGTGKSICYSLCLHLCPQEYVQEGSLSDKAAFYAELKPGTIIFIDDVTLTDDLTGTIKRSTSSFQKGIKHMSVNKQTNAASQTGLQKQELGIPARVSWWINSVLNSGQKELLNRQLLLETDETPAQDEKVYKKQVELAVNGTVKLPETDDVLICREIIRDLKEHTPFIVKIPFADTLDWKFKNDRRAFPTYCDII